MHLWASDECFSCSSWSSFSNFQVGGKFQCARPSAPHVTQYPKVTLPWEPNASFFLLESWVSLEWGWAADFLLCPSGDICFYSLTSALPRGGRFRIFIVSLVDFGHSVNTPPIHTCILSLSSHIFWPGSETGKLVNCYRAVMSQTWRLRSLINVMCNYLLRRWRSKHCHLRVSGGELKQRVNDRCNVVPGHTAGKA